MLFVRDALRGKVAIEAGPTTSIACCGDPFPEHGCSPVSAGPAIVLAIPARGVATLAEPLFPEPRALVDQVRNTGYPLLRT